MVLRLRFEDGLSLEDELGLIAARMYEKLKNMFTLVKLRAVHERTERRTA